MKLSRPAVLVLAVIWMTVLLAPPLNLLFRTQLRGSDTIRFSALPAPESTPNFWEKAARRFPDDKNILLQAAQEYPALEITEEEEEEYGDGFEPDAYWDTAYLSHVFPGQIKPEPKHEKLRRLNWLLQKHPRDATLIAVYLTAALDTAFGRAGGEMSDVNVYRNQALGIPSPEVSKEKPAYSKADLLRAIELCTRGQQLEPDNGYFDWMKCCFLMLAWRDGEAFNALDAAAGKKRFDDHTLEAQQSQFKARSTALGRQLLMEEKIATVNVHTFPQYGRYREMTRILSWQSVKAQRRGDHAQALRITAALARTAARMRESSRTYTEGMVAAAMEAIAWGGPTHDARQKFGRRLTPNQRISSFSDYAKKHGRPELAIEAANNSAAAAAFRNAASTRTGGSIFGISFGFFLAATLMWIAGVLLLLLLAAALLLSLAMWVLKHVRRARALFRLQESTPDEVPSPREVWNGALAFGGLRALATLLGGGVTLASCFGALLIAIGQGKGLFDSIPTAWSDLVTAGGNYSNIEGIYVLLSTNNTLLTQWRVVALLSPLLLGALFVAWRAIEWQKRQNGEPGFRTGALFKALFTGRIFQTEMNPRERDGLNIADGVLRLLNFVVTFLLLCAWILLASSQSTDGSIAWLLPLFFVLLFGTILLFENFTDWRKRSHRRATVRYGLRLLQRSSLAWLIAGSSLYFALLLVSLPIRNYMDARIDRTLAVGEVRAQQANRANTPGF